MYFPSTRPEVSHGNESQEGLILPSSVGEKKSTQEMSQTQWEAEHCLQVEQMERLELQKNDIKKWLCFPVHIVNNKPVKLLETGQVLVKQGACWTASLVTGRDRDDMSVSLCLFAYSPKSLGIRSLC